MTKYHKCFQEMLKENKDLFEKFKVVHDNFAQDRKKYKDEFNRVGAEVVTIIKRYENILCGHSENTGYAKFSSTLADKFWVEIRALYPRIDFVGIK
ncbi:MAG: hypothetical protein A3J50_01325 [Candidatus Woykebacteria bacterium RIFCSPHIGHO2_02_FULL_43_16b]|uniref:Uncharacterized protein n=1 Tax=Candidatus Woykebacteria bacterium RIFCSPHIGHO2_02_FULL_43_16b TaxID=1802601 RepID=A0A1G1WLZ7_9BACT|nr:MAG: hypothetical protein A3J50_01325 [Candidatus Woykebacteria bacterium RIFCSPHIGHO2_02_FULL_43_16b]